MSQISKCPKLRVVSGYWEALGEVSELRYKNLLYISSKRSYCSKVSTSTDLVTCFKANCNMNSASSSIGLSV